MPAWLDALQAAGLVGLPFLWTADGEIVESPSAPMVTDAQRARIAAIFAAHAGERPFVVAPSLVPPMEPSPGG